jgi:cephalosporin-C deacetylase-like acetyl esterase
MDSPKYEKFDISEVTYKVANGQDIKAFIMVPKKTTSGSLPVIAKFHGGFFVSPYYFKAP